MKKLLSVLLVSALVLCLSGTSQAYSIANGPVGGPGIFKTWNWEIGTTYYGGEAGKFYFLNESATYDTVEFGTIGYDAGTDGLISELAAIRDDNMRDNESSFGLLEVRTFGTAHVGPVDSRFGDGSNAIPWGNDIIEDSGGGYWATGDEGEYLRGVMWGSQDTVVQCIMPGDAMAGTEGIYRIWSAGGQYELWLADYATYDPETDPAYSPDARPDAIADPEGNDFPGWFDRDNDTLFASGDFGYFRFQGNWLVNENGDVIINGNTEVVFGVDPDAGSIMGDLVADGRILDWWTHPEGADDAEYFEVWQSWNIGNPFSFSNGWTGSEDSARFYRVVPEPVTMLGMFLAVGSLGGYIRRRKLA